MTIVQSHLKFTGAVETNVWVKVQWKEAGSTSRVLSALSSVVYELLTACAIMYDLSVAVTLVKWLKRVSDSRVQQTVALDRNSSFAVSVGFPNRDDRVFRFIHDLQPEDGVDVMPQSDLEWCGDGGCQSACVTYTLMVWVMM